MSCHSHRQLVSIQLCPALPPPSSSSCIWNPPSTFHSRAPACMCSSVALFLCGLVLSTAVLAWQCCHHSFWACDQTSSTFFFSAEPTPVPGRSSSIDPCWIFCLASRCLRFFLNIYSQKLFISNVELCGCQFNDVLLYTIPVTTGFKVQHVLPLTGMKVRPHLFNFVADLHQISTDSLFSYLDLTLELEWFMILGCDLRFDLRFAHHRGWWLVNGMYVGVGTNEGRPSEWI